MEYHCSSCQKWFDYDDFDVQERVCPDCGDSLVDEDSYHELKAISENTYGDIECRQDSEGNFYY